MNNKKIEEAFTNVDDKYILETIKMINGKNSKKGKNTSFITKLSKMAACLVMIIAISSVGVVSAVAAGNMTAYEILYSIDPEMAVKLSPVNVSCIDQGIEMTVEGINIDGDTADIYISLIDLEEDRIDETVDLFDSYNIESHCDQIGGCSFVSYDQNSKMATFLLNVKNMNGKPITGNKLNFSITQLLLKKSIIRRKIDYSKDLILYNETHSGESTITHGEDSKTGYEWTEEVPVEDGATFLATDKEKVLKICDQVSVCGYGFVDDNLHVQVAYSDIFEYDTHGFIVLNNGDEDIVEDYSYTYDNSENGLRYYEYVFNISEEEFQEGNYTMEGEFTTCSNKLSGDWNVSVIIK